jgi:hypothetical protein
MRSAGADEKISGGKNVGRILRHVVFDCVYRLELELGDAFPFNVIASRRPSRKETVMVMKEMKSGA